MTTSGSTDFTVTAGNIIKDAASLAIGIDDLNELSPEQQSDIIRMLNMMVKSWQTKVDLWPTTDVQHTLTPGTESYTVSSTGDISTPRPLQLISCRRENSSGIETKVQVVSREEYKSLPSKSTQAPVNIVYYDPQLSAGVLYVWPTGSTNDKILNLTFKRPIEDFDQLSNSPDFPQEWYLALVYNLASMVGDLYGMPVSPGVENKALMYLAELEAFDTEGASVFIQPNLRG